MTDRIRWPLVLSILPLALLALTWASASENGPYQSTVYEPSNWQPLPDEETGWFETCGGVEVHTYMHIASNEHEHGFRHEFEVFNTTERDIVIVAQATLQTKDRAYAGDMIRLFSPEGQNVPAGGYAEFAAIFDFGTSLQVEFGPEIEIRFATESAESKGETCMLSLVRRDEDAAGKDVRE